MKPIFVEYLEIDSLKSKHSELFIFDKTHDAIDELFDIAYPKKKDIKTAEDIEEFARTLIPDGNKKWGSWVYYPWLNYLVHFPPKELYRSLRSSRNRNLITEDEQKTLYAATIAVVGMSVGSNVVEALVSGGIGGTLILVDMDYIEPSNLNRIRSPYYHVGLHKVDAISRKVWEIDPYINIVHYRDGLNEENIEKIISPEINILIDEMDELRMKIRLREVAKSLCIPVIMAADDGDNSLIDIDRYDIDNNTEILNGLIPKEVLLKIKTEKLSRKEIGATIGKYFIGVENIPLRMFESLAEVGKSLPSWPQLGGAAALSGVTMSYVAKNIILGNKINSGRILVSLDEKLSSPQLDDGSKHNLDMYKLMILE